MISYNHVVVIGILTRDPDVKTVGKTAMKLARLSVCINEKRKTQDGKFIDNPVFVDVDAWARMADMCEKYLAKNSLVFVEGKLQMAQWEKDGVKHQKLKIRASNIKLLPKGGRFNGAKDGSKGSYSKKDSAAAFDNAAMQESETFVPDDNPDGMADDDFAEAFTKW